MKGYDKMEKYIVNIEKAGESTYFFKLLYQIKDEKLEKIEDIIYPNCNKLKITARRGEYFDISGLYDSNIEILENADFAILKIQNSEDLKIDSNYYEELEGSTKFYTYLNKIILENLDEKIYEIVNLNDIVLDFFQFKHDDIPLELDNEPLTQKIFIEFESNIYGPFKYEKREEKYFFKPLDTKANNVKKYELDDLSDIIYNISTKNFERKIIVLNEINLKLKNNPELKEEKEDFIKKELLISQFINQVKNDEKKLSKTEVSLLKEKLKKDSINLSSAERRKIIEDKVNEDEIYFQIKEKIINDILNDEDKLKNICKKIATENFSEIQKNSDISRIIQELENKKEIKEKELENLKYNIEKEERELEKILNNKERELEIHNDKKLQDLKNQLITETKNLDNIKKEIYRLDEECKVKIDKLNFVDNLEKLKEENHYLERRKNEYNVELNELNQKIETLKKEAEKYSQEEAKGYSDLLSKAIEKIKEEYKNNYFEFFTFNKLQEIENEKYQEEMKVKFTKNLTTIESTKNIFINDFIEEQLKFFNEKAYRKIQKNDLINIFLCISQGFLTIFAGEPGVGKTSLCRILGKSLGLYNNKESSRYIEVSVEKGWTSKRDFIGYYNPLSKRIDYSNKKIFRALTLLDFEEKENLNNYPFLFVLDEANLSPMEYYWADFMNICDINLNEERTINIGDDYSYSLPKTLRFLATINYDHTTEVLSPRLLDRAWIILLENTELDINALNDIRLENFQNIIPYSVFEELKDVEGKMFPLTLENRLKEIISYLRIKNIVVSPRVQKMIKNYCIKGNELFEKRKNDLISLDYAVSQKLLPLLEGYGEDYREFLKKFCENQLSGMEKCQKIIEEMISKGDKNMKHYYFFHR